MIFWMIVVFVIALVLAISAMPKPQTQKPPGYGDVQLPTTEEGRELPVLFGTRDLWGPIVAWWGDFRTIAVKKKSAKK